MSNNRNTQPRRKKKQPTTQGTTISFDAENQKGCACGHGILPFYDECVRCAVNAQRPGAQVPEPAAT